MALCASRVSAVHETTLLWGGGFYMSSLLFEANFPNATNSLELGGAGFTLDLNHAAVHDTAVFVTLITNCNSETWERPGMATGAGEESGTSSRPAICRTAALRHRGDMRCCQGSAIPRICPS